MASNSNNDNTPPEPKSKKKYFKSMIPSLAVQTSAGDSDRVSGTTEYVSFKPFWITLKTTGEVQRFGLYSTDDPNVHELFETNSDIVEIDKKVYDELEKEASPVA